MGFSLKNLLNEALAQANTFDGGQTAHTVAATRPVFTPNQPQPAAAPVVQQPQRVVQPVIHRNVFEKAYDQLNPFDNARSFKQAAPTNDASLIHQVTHNGTTNAAGSLLNNVFAVPSIIDTARLGLAEVTHNQPAIDSSTVSLAKNLPRFLPIGATESFKDGFGQDIATALTAPFAQRAARQQADYYRQTNNDQTGDPVHDTAVDANASAIEGDLLNQHLHTGGADMNTSLAGDFKHVGGDAAATAANIAMFGKVPGLEGAAVLDEAGKPVLNAAGQVVRQAPSILKTAPVYGGLNATSGMADTVANDPNATGLDVAKAGGEGFVTGAAFPVAMHGAGKLIENTPQIISAARQTPAIITDAVSTSTKAAARAMVPKYNGLTANEIIMNPKHLDTLHNAKQDLVTAHSNVPLAQSVITGLHDIKNTYGHDFVTGSRGERMQRINQFLEQNGEAIPEYQKTLVEHETKLAKAKASGQGGYARNPFATEMNKGKKLLQQLDQVSHDSDSISNRIDTEMGMYRDGSSTSSKPIDFAKAVNHRLSIKKLDDRGSASGDSPLMPANKLIANAAEKLQAKSAAKAKAGAKGVPEKIVSSKESIAPHEKFAQEYADSLRQIESGLKGGDLIRKEARHSGVGDYTRTTDHSPFYRQHYADNGKPPTKADWLAEAKRQLESGKADEYAQKEYNSLKNPETQSLISQPESYFSPDTTRGESLLPKTSAKPASFKHDPAQATFKGLQRSKQFPNSYEPAKLGDVLDHPALFDKYPQLKDYTVKYKSVEDMRSGTIRGAHDIKNKEIILDRDMPDSERLPVLMHEVQHAIQGIEGRLPKGGSSSEVLGRHEYINNPIEVEARKVGDAYKQPKAAASESAATPVTKLSAADHAKLIQAAEDAYVAEKISAATLEKVRKNPDAYAQRFLKQPPKAATISAPLYDAATFDESVNKLRKQIQNINRKASINHDSNGDAILVHTAENQAKIDKLHQRIDAYYGSKHQAEGTQIVKDVKAKVAAKHATKPTAVDVSDYIEQQTKAQDEARKGESGFDKFRNELKTKLVDSLHPIEDTLNKAQKDGAKVDEEHNIKYQLDRAIRGDTIGAQYIHDHGLAHIIQTVPDTNVFDQYLIAKHAADLAAKGIKTGRNLAADKQLIAEHQAVYEPYAQQVKDYGHKLLDTAANYGLISKKLAGELKTMYPNYVPLNRIFGDGELPTMKGTGSGKASISSQSIVKRIKGSTRQIESPLSSLVQKSVDVVKEGERNKAAQILTGYKSLPGNPFSLRELGKNETVGTKPVISVLKDGKVHRFETTKEIADAAKSLTKEQLGLVGKILSIPTRVLRLGATGLNPAFALANVTKDTVSAFINSSHPLQASAANPKVFVAAFKAAMNHSSAEYAELVREGAGGTSFDIARDAPRQNVKLIRAEATRTSKVMYNVTHPGELFRAAENTIGRSEEFNRAIQYYGNKQAALREGKTDAQARIYGADSARNDTVNFARAGDYGRVLNSVLPYLNAGIQGSRTLLRNLKDRPVRTTGKLVATVFIPTATVTAWNLSNDDRKQAYDDIPEYEKQNNIIIVPPHPVKDPKTGKWNVIKIPVSQEIANLNDIVRNGIEAGAKDGSLNIAAVAGNLLGTATSLNTQSPRQVVGQLTPQAIKPGVESLTNQNLFTGSKIVPDSQKNLPPRDQIGKFTSGTATELGKYTGISPEHIDNFISTASGGLGQNIVNTSDRALAAAHVISPNQVQGKSFPDAVSGRFYGARGKSPGAIADEHQKTYSGQLEKLPGYQSMTTQDKAKALNRLQSDVNHVYIPPSDGSQQKLSVRQQHLMEGKPDLESYLTTKAASGGSGGSGNSTASTADVNKFKTSNARTMVSGNQTYYKKKDGTIGHQNTYTYTTGARASKLDLTMSTSKATGDYSTWSTSAVQKYHLIQDQIAHHDPNTEAKQVNDLTKQANTLSNEIKKYQGYGGSFTKPKSGKSAVNALKRSYTPYAYSTSNKTRNSSLKSLLASTTHLKGSSTGASRKARSIVKLA